MPLTKVFLVNIQGLWIERLCLCDEFMLMVAKGESVQELCIVCMPIPRSGLESFLRLSEVSLRFNSGLLALEQAEAEQNFGITPLISAGLVLINIKCTLV